MKVSKNDAFKNGFLLKEFVFEMTEYVEEYVEEEEYVVVSLRKLTFWKVTFLPPEFGSITRV